MVSRLVLLLYIAASNGVMFVVEQPKGSLLQYHPRFQQLMADMQLWRKFISMRAFGAHSSKGTWLYSNRMCVQDVGLWQCPVSDEVVQLVNTYVDKNGRKHIRRQGAQGVSAL